MQEAAGNANPASTLPLGAPSHPEEGPATAADGNGTAAPPLNSLQQQWAPEPEEEEEEEEEEENVGQWSPVPLDAQHIGNQDVVHEDEDQRLIDLLRKQVSPDTLLMLPCLSYAELGPRQTTAGVFTGLACAALCYACCHVSGPRVMALPGLNPARLCSAWCGSACWTCAALVQKCGVTSSCRCFHKQGQKRLCISMSTFVLRIIWGFDNHTIVFKHFERLILLWLTYVQYKGSEQLLIPQKIKLCSAGNAMIDPVSDYLQVQYKEASRFRAAASAAAAGAAPGLNEADRAYRQMVSDPSSSVHPMLRYLQAAMAN